MTAFADLGVRSHTGEALQRLRITRPLAVQARAIPPLLAGRDVVIEAPTGSGKTLGFLVPMVERLGGHRGGGTRALVVVPTRELATQIAGVLRGVDAALRTVLVFGGTGYGPQLGGLRGSPDVVVGCPGRLLDLVERRVLPLRGVEYLVLDEADEMLDQGFARDVERLIALCDAPRRQTVLASATMPDWVQTMVARHLRSPERVSVDAEQVPDLEHGIVAVAREERLATLSALLRRHDTAAIVFHRTKHGARKLARDLTRLGHRTAELQGNLSQNARDRAIAAFRRGEADVLVATNVAARGLDVAHVGLVVNYELPETALWLTHRVGRTARNGAEGRALTLLGEDDAEQWRKLRRLGAPALSAVDREHLLATGEMRTLAQPPGFLVAGAAAAGGGDGGRRSGARRGGPGGPAARPLGAGPVQRRRRRGPRPAQRPAA